MVKLGNEDPKIKEQIKVADKAEDKCDHCGGKEYYS